MTDINELMGRDPLKCSDQDIDEIVRVFRERRKQFDRGNLIAGRTKPVTAKTAESMKAVGKLDLKKLLGGA